MLDAVKYLNTVAGLSLTLSSFLENWNVIVEVEKVSRNGVLIN